ncbi:hypothetical protein [Dyella silvae]|uniref:hypothetical protein n=1 Tax=Dyella silvae TaxID=2994424 RepID=UPI002263BD50|nr:hypothetical protein [Dyella silvae]
MGAHAGTVNCTTAASYAEKFICSDAHAAAFDANYAEHFALLKSHAADPAAFEAKERAAVADRNARCQTSACVLDWYIRRNGTMVAEAYPPQIPPPPALGTASRWQALPGTTRGFYAPPDYAGAHAALLALPGTAPGAVVVGVMHMGAPSCMEVAPDAVKDLPDDKLIVNAATYAFKASCMGRDEILAPAGAADREGMMRAARTGRVMVGNVTFTTVGFDAIATALRRP